MRSDLEMGETEEKKNCLIFDHYKIATTIFFGTKNEKTK